MNHENDEYVATSRCMIGTKRQELLPGHTLSASDLVDGEAGIKRMLENGHIKERTVGMTSVPQIKVEGSPMVPKDLNPGDMKGNSGKPTELTPEQIAAARNKSPFAMDPDGITGMSLEELNNLIQDRDSRLPIMESKEKAIAYLSKDFEPVG